VAQDDAPGWLNWGSDAPSAQAEARSEAPPAGMVEADESPAQEGVPREVESSGQAVLIRRLMRRVDALETDVRQLRGALSEQERDAREREARLEEALREMRKRIAQSAASPRPEPASDAAVDPTDPVAGDMPDEALAAVDAGGASAETPDDSDQAESADTRDVLDPAEQQRLYNEAFEILKAGRYDEAVAAFQAVIDADPSGSWAASALFWQGETYYVQQDYAAAGKAYAEVVERFPDSARLPDARLKMGYVAEEMGDRETARRLFRQVMEEHPDSQAAGLAKQRLDRLGG
jgi:tol-pal system protein YbgF